MKLRKLLALAMAAVLAVSSASVAVAAGTSVGESDDLATAISNASDGDTITLTGNVTLNEKLTINKNLVIEGAGYTITDGTSEGGSLFTITGGVVEFKNVNIDAVSSNHAVNAYDAGSAGTEIKLTDVEVNGGAYTSVLVNGAKASFDGCTFNSNGYADVEAGVGQKVTKLPEISVVSGNVEVYVDRATIENIKDSVPGYDSMGAPQIVNAIKKQITGSVTWDVPEGNFTTVSNWTDLKREVESGNYDTVYVDEAITVPIDATLDGANKTQIVLTKKLDSGAFITMGDGATISNVTIDTDGNAKHGVQFYKVNSGTLDNVTIYGGYFTSIIVNGSTNIEIKDCTTNPDDSDTTYANIEYAMGKGVTTVPEFSVSGLTYDQSYPAIYVDAATIEAMKQNGSNADEVFKKITGEEGLWVQIKGENTNKPEEPESPTPDRDSDNDDGGDYFGNETWDEVKREIAKAEEGDTIKVSATGLPYFPSSVARALKGLDITLEVRKNGVTYEVNGLEIGDIDKIWYEFDELETELLTADADSEASSEADEEAKPIPDTGR